ncbi:MAG: penicillin-binding transpeptidase domain-containing protein [Lachnospirales bacterium]
MKKNNKNKKTREANIGYASRLMLMLLVAVIALSYVGFYRVYAIKAKGDEYEAAAVQNQVNKVQDKVLSPNKGDILDRNGETLALGETVYNIILDVKLLVEQEAYQAKLNAKRDEEDKVYPVKLTCEALDRILGIKEETIRSYIATDSEGNPAKNTHYFVLQKKVPFAKGKEINDLGYNWLYGEQDSSRSYPNGQLAAQVLGFSRGESVWGLESKYSSEMTGIPGRTFRTYEEDGSIVTQKEQPIKGNTLVTTLDVNLQRYADEVCKQAYDEYKPKNTSSIIMNPNTGEVYAMAQYPSFDPNDPMKITDLEKEEINKVWDKMKDEDKLKIANSAWKNVNISNTFEPGSIYKPIVVAMALEEGIISPDDVYVCGGSKTVGGSTIHCHARQGHGPLNVTQILAQSCNVGMMDIIAKMSPETYLKYQHDFGFGEKTGIDLPAESSASNLLYSLNSLHSVEMATSSFGQGFSCTSIQALNAFCALINGGKLMKPYVVSQIIDNEGNLVEQKEPHVVRNVISKQTSDWVREALKTTMTEGTGSKAQIAGYSIGGKTGTAEQGDRSKDIYALSFIAYHSVENPDIIAMVMIYDPEGYGDSGGAATPAPGMKKLLEDIIEYEDLQPDYEGEDKDKETQNTSYTVKDYTNSNLKSTIAELIGNDIDFEIIGSGDTIANQSPAGGTRLERKPSKILLNIVNKNNSELVPVPNVSGLSVDNAKKMLESSGFKVSVSEEDAEIKSDTTSDEENVDSEDNEDEDTSEKKTKTSSSKKKSTEKTVYVQMPSASARVESGTTVKIRAR